MLYPPIIEGTLPSFWIKSGTGTTLSVPFSMNEAVGQNEVYGFSIRIKSVIQNEVILTLEASSFNFLTNEALFRLTASEAAKLNIGQFYKVQLAYIDKKSIVGYYSTVGVVKCTGQPTVYIEGLETYSTNGHRYNYTGYYINEADNTEKVYSYQFLLYDSDDNIYKDSGVILHNSQTNISDTESCDSFTFSFDLDKGKTYFIQYKIITNNQMEVSSLKYRIRQNEFVSMEVPATLSATLNYDNGYVDIVLDEGPKGYWARATENDFINYETRELWIKTRDIDGNITGYESAGILDKETCLKGVFYIPKSLNNYYISGNFIITKSSNLTDFKEWDKVATIKVEGRGPVFVERRDFAVEQGKVYKYAIQQYNDYEMLSERYITPEVYVDFEDMFLTDGDRQLKIRFNPKVTSFKTDRLEAKVDTIGGKYPFIFRNEQVEYKEFPIAGLLSYWSDENNLFMTDSELGLYPEVNKRRSTNSRKEERLSLIEAKVNELNTKLYDEEEEWIIWRENYLTQDLEVEMIKELENYQNSYTQLLLSRVEQSELKTNLKTNVYKTHDLVDRNIAAERIFKLEVLDWLNNGKPKLFRSPGEGNYIVRLMNISLAPEDGLGRMLHTFSGTAYEIADCTYENLVDLDIVRVDELVFRHLLYKTKRLSWSGYEDGSEYDPEIDGDTNPFIAPDGKVMFDYTGTLDFLFDELIDAEHMCYSVLLTDMQPGTQIVLDGQVITIGATGSYYAEYENGMTNIYIPKNNYYQGSITYSYYGVQHLEFDLIVSENVEEHACRQFIGDGGDVIDKINDVKTELISLYYLDFFKRPVLDVNYYQYDTYFDKEGNQVYFEDMYEDGKYFVQNERTKEYTRFYLTPAAENNLYTQRYNKNVSDEQYKEYLEKEKIRLILGTTFYKTRYGEGEFNFTKRENLSTTAFNLKYTTKVQERLYYKDKLTNTEYFDYLNELYLYRFQTKSILLDDVVYDLDQEITILKDIHRDKYLVSEEVYNQLPQIVKSTSLIENILNKRQSDINKLLYGKEVVLNSDWEKFKDDAAEYLGYTINNGLYFNQNNQQVIIKQDHVDELLAYRKALQQTKFEVYNTKTTINAEYILADDYSSRRLAADDDALPYGKYYIYDKETKQYVESIPSTPVGEQWIDNDRTAVWDEVNQKYDYVLKYYVYNIERISIDLELEEEYSVPNIDQLSIDTVPLPNGLYLNTGYKTIVSTYSIESTSQDKPFINYRENLNYFKAAIEHANTFYEEIIARDASNMDDLLAQYQENLVDALNQKMKGDDYAEIYESTIEEYLQFLDVYEQYLAGEIDLNINKISAYPQLEVIANQILVELDAARENYYSAYQQYITRLEWLIKKYREEGDYAYDY